MCCLGPLLSSGARSFRFVCASQQATSLKLPNVALTWASLYIRRVLKSQEQHCGRSTRQLAKSHRTWRARKRFRGSLTQIRKKALHLDP